MSREPPTPALERCDPAEWSALAARFADHNYRQSPVFGEACAARHGATSECVRMTAGGGVLLGLAHVRIKRLPLIGGGIAYINGGPLVRQRGEARAALTTCLTALRMEYVVRRGLVLRVVPPLGDLAWNAEQTLIFGELGFLPSETSARYRTFIVDLSPPLDEIRKRLKQKWRNCLNSAERNDLTVRRGTDAEVFRLFAALYDKTLARKGFTSALDAEFYAHVQARTPLDDAFSVTLIEYAGTAIAGHVGSTLGDTCVYILGASDEAALKLKASYLLQWEVLQRAREHGCRWYDLGGIDPEANPGVFHFKEGLGGTDIAAPGAFDLRSAALNARLVCWAERAYRWWRNRHGQRRSPRFCPE